MDPISLSVVIPTCQRLDALAECLARLASGAQTLPADSYEVIVTDDGSQPTAEPMLREQFPWARWFAGPRRGPAANRNYGARQARGEWLVFLDDDCVPAPGVLAAYVAARKQSPGSTVLEGRTRAIGVRTRLDMECPINETGGYLWSCNFCIRRSVFVGMGGFDEKFPSAFMEDVDLRLRLRKAGEPTAFVPEAEVGHGWRLRRGCKFVRLQARSTRYFLAKHPEERAKFRCRKIAIDGLRRIYRALRTACALHLWRGLGRFVALEIYYLFCLTRALASPSDRQDV